MYEAYNRAAMILTRVPRANLEIIILILLMTAIFIYAYTTLANFHAPSGADAGNWLAFTKELFGQDVKRADVTYPPIMMIILRFLMTFLDDLNAVKTLGILVMTTQMIPAYLLSKRFIEKPLAAMASLLFVLSGYTLETISYGGYSIMLGTSFMIMALNAYSKIKADAGWQAYLKAAIWASLMVGTHHLITVFFVACFLTYNAISCLHEKKVVRLATALKFILVSAVLSLPFTPFYSTILSNIQTNPFGPQGFQSTNLNQALTYVFKENTLIWYAFFGATVLYLVNPVMQAKLTNGKIMISSFLICAFVLFMVLSEIRFMYLTVFATAIGVCLIVSSFIRQSSSLKSRVIISIAVIVVVLIPIIDGGNRFQESVAFYRVVDTPAEQAMTWLRYCTPEDVVVIAGSNPSGFYYTWWIDGFSERHSVPIGDLRWLIFENEIRDGQIANYIISRQNADELHSEMLVNHMQVLFIDKEAVPEVPIFTFDNGLDILYENQRIIILGYNVLSTC